LASEDIHSSKLCDFGRAFKDFVAPLVRRLDLYDQPAITHTNMADPDGKFISGENHTDEINVVPDKPAS
jgi:hypothetical protein